MYENRNWGRFHRFEIVFFLRHFTISNYNNLNKRLVLVAILAEMKRGDIQVNSYISETYKQLSLFIME